MLNFILKSLRFLLITPLSFLISYASPIPTIKVGVTEGPHADVMRFVAQKLKPQLNLQVIEFNDFILPNQALDQGDLDANCYQHQSFLSEQIHSRHYKLTPLHPPTLLFPIHIYSQKFKSPSSIPPNSKIAIPNDPSNAARALLLLQDAKLISLNPTPSNSSLFDLSDISHNPKNLKFIEIDAPQLPRVLPDVAAAIINTDWALLANLNPDKDSIFSENPNSPYANVFVVRTQNKDNPIFQTILHAYQSPDTETFIKQKFGPHVIPAWKNNNP